MESLQSDLDSDEWTEGHAILIMADVVESMRLLRLDERTQARRISRLVDRLTKYLAQHFPRSQVLECRGDGLLIRCDTVGTALDIAACVHEHTDTVNANELPDRQLWMRVGVHADVLWHDGERWFGSGMGIAARVSSIARPGETVLSDAAKLILESEERPASQNLENLGNCYFKHAFAPLHLWRWGSQAGNVDMPAPEWPVSTETLPSLAILPLATTVTSPEARVAADLLVESLTYRLSGSKDFRVISHLSVSGAKLHGLPPTTQASVLGCDYFIAGSLHLRGDTFTTFIELSIVGSSIVQCAERVEGKVNDLLALRSEAIEHLAFRLHSSVLSSRLADLRFQPLPSLDSHALLRNALMLMHRNTQEEFARAQSMLSHLVERHPRSGLPRSWLAKWHLLRVAQGWSDQVSNDIDRAQSAASQALSLDPSNALSCVLQGAVHGYLGHDFDRASGCYAQALQNNPNEALAHLQLAALCGWTGRAEEARHHAQTALSLSPLDPQLYFYYCLSAAAHLGAGDWATAEQQACHSLNYNSTHIATYKVLMLAQSLQGKVSEARRTAARLKILSPDFTVSHFDRHAPWGAHPNVADFRHALSEAGVPAL